MNPTLKKILLAIMIILLASAVKVFVNNMTSKVTSRPTVEELMAQEVSKMKSECPIKYDEITSLVDVNFEPDKKKLTYLFKIDSDDENLKTKEFVTVVNSFMGYSLCKSFMSKLPKDYSSEMLYLGKDNNKITSILLDSATCEKFEKMGPPPEELKEYFDTPQTQNVK